jgi:hypothetical protein
MQTQSLLHSNLSALPTRVREVLDRFSEMEFDYEGCIQLQIALRAVGYTCDFDLEGVPYGLKPLN